MIEKHIIKLDSTMIKAHMNCPRYFQLAYRQHLRTLRPSAPLEFGTAIHKGLEIMHLKNSLSQGLTAFLLAYPEEIDDRRTHEVGKAILADYFNHRHEEFDLDIRIEEGFAFEINLDPVNAVLLVGRIDRIRKGLLDPEEIWISDWKTASRIGPSYVAAYVRDIQMGIYYCGATFLLGQCDGVAIDVLPVMKKSTAPQRYEYDYSSYEDQILGVVESEAKEILAHEGQDFWPQKWTFCNSYGSCPYQDICYHNGDPSRIIETLYKVEQWEPWKGILKEEEDAMDSSDAGPIVDNNDRRGELDHKKPSGVAVGAAFDPNIKPMGDMASNVSHALNGE